MEMNIYIYVNILVGSRIEKKPQAVAQRHEMAMVDDHAEADYAQAAPDFLG
jgi:hypothetical protein